MPLIVMCGYPLSGKTTVAELIEEALSGLNIEIVRLSDLDYIRQTNDQSIDSLSKIYSNNIEEKRCRSFLKFEVAKYVGKKGLVILDSLNYIKGYRYELRCSTLLYKTQHCTVYCDCSKEIVLSQRNREPKKYSDKVLNEIIERFEIPNATNKSDKPLFVVDCATNPVLPNDLVSYLLGELLQKPEKGPNKCTLSIPYTDPSLLSTAGRITNSIIKELLNHTKSISSNKHFENVLLSQYDAIVEVPIGPDTKPTVTLGELLKMRQQFLRMLKQRPLIDEPGKNCEQSVITAFVHFLNTQIKAICPF